jgi:hypothetical protein
MIHGDRTTRIDELEEQVTVASFRSAPAHEVAAAQLGECGNQLWLVTDPCSVFGDHLGTRAVTTFDERIAPLASRYVTPLAANVDGASR